jgi:hypothetical protein
MAVLRSGCDQRGDELPGARPNLMPRGTQPGLPKGRRHLSHSCCRAGARNSHFDVDPAVCVTAPLTTVGRRPPCLSFLPSQSMDKTASNVHPIPNFESPGHEDGT